MKKIIITTFTLCLLATSLTGCGRKEEPAPTPEQTTVTEATSETTTEETGMVGKALSEIGDAIERIGEWPSMVLVEAEDEFLDMTGLDMKNENYKQVYMRRSNLEGGFGEYIIIEADDVEAALRDLEARKERLISMDTPYEEHTELAKGAIVGKNGNYVYLIARENPKEVEDELLSHLG